MIKLFIILLTPSTSISIVTMSVFYFVKKKVSGIISRPAYSDNKILISHSLVFLISELLVLFQGFV